MVTPDASDFLTALTAAIRCGVLDQAAPVRALLAARALLDCTFARLLVTDPASANRVADAVDLLEDALRELHEGG